MSTFGGGVINTGKITALSDSGIDFNNVSTFAGSITNSGKIAAGDSGIDFNNVSTFVGAIVNSGTITSTNDSGIDFGFVSTFTGGITNSGKIAAADSGIDLNNVSTFAGGISNAGIISANNDGVLVEVVVAFSGGISNGGTIWAVGNGLDVQDTASFVGGISNGGAISAHAGIELGAPPQSSVAHGVAFFSGNIFNSSSILAETGIGIFDSTIQGAIVDSGRIAATAFGSNGILVNGGDFFGGVQIASHGVISAQSDVRVVGATVLGGITNSGIVAAEKTAIAISAVTTLSGGIINRGTIRGGLATGAAGIAVTQVHAFGDSSAGGGGITNTGTISAAFEAIFLQSVPTFAGAIVNSGKLVAETGIHYGVFTVFGGSASGGITNTGTITASDRGILLALVGPRHSSRPRQYFRGSGCQHQRDRGARHRNKD